MKHTKSRRQLAERQRSGWRVRVSVAVVWEVQKPAMGGSGDRASYARMSGASSRAQPLEAVSTGVHSAAMMVWGPWPWSRLHLGLDIM